MTRLMEQLRGGERVASRVGEVDLSIVAKHAVEQCQDRLPRPALQVDSEPRIKADADRLAAIIEHLIRNAQDACRQTGAVHVSVAQEGDVAMLVVADDGAGMTQEFIRERLFRPFDSTKGAKGMGIGAYQVREYVQAVGGQLEVQSSPGQGARFCLRLPRLLSAAPVVPSTHSIAS